MLTRPEKSNAEVEAEARYNEAKDVAWVMKKPYMNDIEYYKASNSFL